MDQLLKLLQSSAMLVVTVALASGRLYSHEWRWFKPSLTSQVRVLQSQEAAALLMEFCQEWKSVKGVGLECAARSRGPAFSDITDARFHPQGVVFGHFLGPKSEDADVSGFSSEGHPSRWGGTLLLSRRDGKWVPQWYKSALITHSCQKVTLPDGREILLCEDEDGGMGHELHYLYSVDLAHPAEFKDSVLAKAESIDDGCQVQLQGLDRVRWTEGEKSFSVNVRTLAFHSLATEPTCLGFPIRKRPPAILTMRFAVTEEGLRKVEGG